MATVSCSPPPLADRPITVTPTAPEWSAQPGHATPPGSGESVGFQIDFDSPDLMQAAPDGTVVVTEHTVGGATLERVDSHLGGGSALRFPVFDPGSDAPRAGLIVTAGSQPLPNPRRADFSFGADVWFDHLERNSSAVDNGDNVIQRGLASEPTQFKLQTDNGRPSCGVTGSGGSVEVKGTKLEEQTWYRLRCVRSHDTLRLILTNLKSGEDEEFEARGGIGAVDFDADVPIAIGHKVTADGKLVTRAPDQFNGTMDAVWIDIGTGR